MSERIAIVSTSYPRTAGDAAGHFVAAEVKQLRALGHEVHVFAPGAGARTCDGVRMHWLADHGAFGFPGALARLRERPMRALGASAFTLRAALALRRAAPFTRVQAHFLVPCAWPIAALALAKRGATALELVGHGSDVRLFCRLPVQLRRQIARAWLDRGAELRVTSHELAELLRIASPELTTRVRVQASPIDLHCVLDRRSARAALGLSHAAQIALVVSRLIPGKRVHLALRALALLDGVSAIVVGDGPELGALSASFPNVRFTGQLSRPQALTFIAAADVLVSASAEEGAPSVVREARALGVPVVAVSSGDLAAWAEADAGLLLVRR